MQLTTSARSPRAAGRGDWKETLGRVGLVGKGTLFVVIGLLAVQLASGNPAESASESGAIEWISQQPFGKFLLVALTVSLFALAVWRLLDAAVGDPVEGSEAPDRAKYAVKGLIYLFLAVGALSATVTHWGSGTGSSGSGGDDTNQEAAATVLEWPAGRWIVAIVGLVMIGCAVYMIKKHTLGEGFLERMSVGADSGIAALGRFGYAAQAVVYAVVGYFFLQAGLTYEADKAKGLSGALKEISGQGWGQWLLWGVAIGLFSYGLFSLAEAKYRRAA